MNLFHNKHITISKEELSELPAATFNGRIVVIDSEDKIKEAADYLSKESCIGFDTETKPSFKKGQINNVALLQLSTHTVCFLFRLNVIGLPNCIKDILENEKITKIGLSIHDDFHNLNKLYPFSPAGFIELQNFVKQYHIADNSLSRIYAIIFGERISKGQRLSNWEAGELSIHQQCYAALDAMACISIYDKLASNGFNPLDSEYIRDIVSHETPIQISESDNITTINN